MEKTVIDRIISQTNLNEKFVINTLNLLEDNTVHFIARYRKEATGNMDEQDIRHIEELFRYENELLELKNSVIEKISTEDKLTPEIHNKILACSKKVDVEEIYAPFKRKKETKGDVAIKKGFLPVALSLLKNQENIPQSLLAKYSKEEILAGATDIITMQVSDNFEYKNYIYQHYHDFGIITSTRIKEDKLEQKAKDELYKFQIYHDFSKELPKLKSYQILALNRGENLKILKVNLVKDDDFFSRFLKFMRINVSNEHALKGVKEGYNRIFASIENRLRNELTEQAHIDSVVVFAQNLYNLLMLKPHYNQIILAIDPGFRTGCKLCVIDQNGTPLTFDKFYLDNQNAAKTILEKLFKEYSIDQIIIGNGTAGKEAAAFIYSTFQIRAISINEDGASVYSVSDAGIEEFPDLDPTDRGTISIGRRYLDCLSELVKVPVTSLGVGMYQHDISEKLLEEKLKTVVEDVVNLVGININTASYFLLANISGLNKRIAKKIFNHRPYKNRAALLKVVDEKIYQQCVGFLRVFESDNILDKTDIHPEQYPLAMAIKNELQDGVLPPKAKEKIVSSFKDVEQNTLDFIIESLHNYQKEKRDKDGVLSSFEEKSLETIFVGQKLKGVVRNITDFGAFVDIGLKNAGFIHISKLADRFVKSVSDFVSIGQEVMVEILEIDQDKKRVSLKKIN